MATTVTTEEAAAKRQRVKPAIVDLDIHEMLPSLQTLVPYLAPQWQTYITDYR
jgi:hypothetical protein